MTMVLTNPQPITVIDVDYILSKCFKDIIEMFLVKRVHVLANSRTLSNADSLHTTNRYILPVDNSAS